MVVQTHHVASTNDLADAALSTPYREPVRLLERREFQSYFLRRLSLSSRISVRPLFYLAVESTRTVYKSQLYCVSEKDPRCF